MIEKGCATTSHAVPLLFVHGGWHGAWCWDRYFLDYFADKGFRVAAVSLRGHGGSSLGTPLNACSIRDYAADVQAAAETLGAAPIVIGHSMGGFVVQAYLETNTAPAAVLMASAPPHGTRKSVLRMTMRHPWTVLKGQFSGETRAVVGTARLARAHLFCAQTPEATVDDTVARLCPESALAMRQMLSGTYLRPEMVTAPVLVLGAGEDGCFKRSEITATAATYSTQPEFFAGLGHNMMLENGWAAVAQRICRWLTDNGL